MRDPIASVLTGSSTLPAVSTGTVAPVVVCRLLCRCGHFRFSCGWTLLDLHLGYVRFGYVGFGYVGFGYVGFGYVGLGTVRAGRRPLDRLAILARGRLGRRGGACRRVAT